jgi:hemolysin activation/secretion protein
MGVKRTGRIGPAAMVLTPALLVAALGLTAPAQAQIGTTGAPTREEIDPTRRRTDVAPSRLQVEGDIERSPCALADPAYAQVMVPITDVQFGNLGDIPASLLRPAYARYLGSKQPVAALCDIRDAAATILRREGYLAAVQVPAQRIENGVVKFEVLLAKLVAVRVRGDAGANEAQIARYLNHIATGGVFNRFQAERYLLLARDMPGMDVRLALKPSGGAPGEMVGEISVRRRVVEADFSAQNLAPGETGPLAGQLRLQLNGLLGRGDRTYVALNSSAQTREQQVLQLGHDLAIGGNGLRLGGRFTYAWTRPDLGPAVPNVVSRTLFANLEASYPLKRGQAASLLGAMGLDFVNQRVRFNGNPLSQDRVRVAYLRLDGERVDLSGRGPGGASRYRFAGSLELRQGLSIFDASRDCLANPVACAAPGVVPPSLIGGSPSATVLRASGLAEYRFGKKLTVSVSPRGQIASGGVFGFERFALGNYTVGRGYDPGTLTGDDGVAVAGEIRHDPLRLSQKARLALQPYAFVDAGWVWSRNLPKGSANPLNLVSAGAGTRLFWSDRARLDLSGAVALKDAGPVKAGDVRVLFTLSTRLIPWSSR